MVNFYFVIYKKEKALNSNMKYTFITITNFKKLIAILVLSVLAIIFCISAPIVYSQTKVYTYSIVIDAGHGGIDGGSEGFNGTKESEINLEYAKTLEQYFKDFGFKTIMTRSNENGLYSPFASNKKKDDMLKRKQIIENSSPDLVVSIHMNSFTLSSSRGAQVFYNKDNENSKLLADQIQKQFVLNLTKARKTSQSADYYILNCASVPSVIVECGFISNQEEETLLNTSQYREKVCYSILCGVVSYLM